MAIVPTISFPTPLHRQVGELIGELYGAHALVDTVLVVNSCARGQATPQSDLDLAILVAPTATATDLEAFDASWQRVRATHPLVRQFENTSRFAQVHLDFFDGEVAPAIWDDGGGPDAFELEIGNRIAYSAPVREAGPHYRSLQSRWLTYYDDALRLQRLAMVREACLYDLERVSLAVGRGLYFHAFDCLYKGFQEFLQALFIARRVYPIAYNKWIREQVAGWLGLPDLYRELPSLLSVTTIESDEVGEKAATLKRLVESWVQS